MISVALSKWWTGGLTGARLGGARPGGPREGLRARAWAPWHT